MSTDTFAARPLTQRRPSSIVLALLLSLATALFFLPPVGPAEAADLEECSGTFSGDPPGSLTMTVTRLDGTTVSDGGAVEAGEQLTVLATWNPLEFISLDKAGICVTIDGAPVASLSILEKPGVNDGSLVTTFTVPDQPGSEVCSRARISGPPNGEVQRELYDEVVSTQKSNIVCFDIVASTPPAADVTAASLEWDCGNVLTVSATNDGDADAELSILQDGVEIATVTVPAESSVDEEITTDLDEGDEATFSVELDGTQVGDDLDVTVACQTPPAADVSAASLAWDCGNVLTVSATNDGDADAELSILQDGVEIATVTVPAESSVDEEITTDLDEGDEATFSVELDGTQVGDDLDVTVACQTPPAADVTSASLAWDCDDGLTVSATNDGDAAGDLQIFKGDTLIDTITVPAGDSISDEPVSGTDLSEDDTATFSVAFEGDELDSLEVTVECEGGQGPPPPPPPVGEECVGGVMVEVHEDTADGPLVGGGESTVEGDSLSLDSDGTTDAGEFECETVVDGTLDTPPTGYTILDGEDQVTVDEDGETLIFIVEEAPTVGGIVEECEGALEIVVIGPDGSVIDGPVELDNVEIVTTFDDDTVECGTYTIALDEDALPEGVSLGEVTNSDTPGPDQGAIQMVTIQDGDDDRVVFELVEVQGVTVERPPADQPAPDAPEQPEPAPDQQPAPEVEARELARTGAYTQWLLMLAVVALFAGTGFLRAADRREEELA